MVNLPGWNEVAGGECIPALRQLWWPAVASGGLQHANRPPTTLKIRADAINVMSADEKLPDHME